MVVAVLCGWEGNCRSGIALAIHHSSVVYHPRAQWPKRGRSTTRLHSCKESGTLHICLLHPDISNDGVG